MQIVKADANAAAYIFCWFSGWNIFAYSDELLFDFSKMHALSKSQHLQLVKGRNNVTWLLSEPSSTSFWYFLSFQTTLKLNVKNIKLVSGARIRTDDPLSFSLSTQPLDPFRLRPQFHWT